MNASPPPDDMWVYDGAMPSIAESEASMKSAAKTVRMRASTARAARIAQAEADRIEGLRQAKNERKK